MTIAIVHLSDIHIRTSSDPVLSLAQKIVDGARPYVKDATHLVLAISGDIAFSGKQVEYEGAKGLIDAVVKNLEDICDEVSIVVCPGNHDCNFDLDNGTRRAIVRTTEEFERPDIDKSMIETCTAIQEPYFRFMQEVSHPKPMSTSDRLRATFFIQTKAGSIGFESLNVSWTSKKHEEIAKLNFPYWLYEDISPPSADVSVVLMHHPFHWFNNISYRDFRKFVRSRVDLVITGHEHSPNAGLIDDSESGVTAFLEGAVLQEAGAIDDASFNVVEIDPKARTFRATSITYRKNQRIFLGSADQWEQLRSLPTESENPFRFVETFRREIEDPGAFLGTTAGKGLTLTDVFVWPDIQPARDAQGQKNYRSALDLLTMTDEFVVIQGDERSGCTSLLTRVALEFQKLDKVPLLLNGRTLRRHSESELDRAIRSAFSYQYGEASWVPYEQLPADRKVLLIDDLDETGIGDPDARAQLLERLARRASRMIATVGPAFEMNALIEKKLGPVQNAAAHFKLVQFGAMKRSALIKRWFGLQRDASMDDATFLAKCDEAERLVNGVMHKSIIPHIPLHLLTLLQSMDAGRSGELKDSALGFYYQFLLTESLQRAGVRPDRYNEQFQYASHLAWRFHQNACVYLTKEELLDFNREFSAKWHTVDFEKRLEVLVQSRILKEEADGFRFHYPYNYYFLKGLFLSRNLQDETIRAYISRSCQHLYVRDNANTILFLAHHSTDEWLLQQISGAMNSAFGERMPLRFTEDLRPINDLIKQAPRLTFSGEPPEKHRERRDRMEDEEDAPRGDGLRDSEEHSARLSLTSQISLLFKTAEI